MFDMFLKLGPEIKGEATDQIYSGGDGWIDVFSWNWGMTQTGTTHIGLGSGGGKGDVQNITLTKRVDSSTHDLIKHVCNGKHIPDANIIVRRAGGDAQVEYYRIDMTDVLITSYQTNGVGGDEQMMETVTLNFGKFEVTYTSQNADGTAGPEFQAGWDIKQNVAV
jgi:type VI secretion system secreted protein Hcp